jgi:hypothetical protein
MFELGRVLLSVGLCWDREVGGGAVLGRREKELGFGGWLVLKRGEGRPWMEQVRRRGEQSIAMLDLERFSYVEREATMGPRTPSGEGGLGPLVGWCVRRKREASWAKVRGGDGLPARLVRIGFS